MIILPPKIERILKYAVSDNNMNILTTVTGAEKLKLHNASYTELFAYKHLESSLIPMGAGFECDSYTVRTHNKLISDISQFSSMALIVFLMSLLGFSAYFNGIGMKIRLKEYQISVLRAIGTPLKRLKSKLIIQSLKIPFTASAIAFVIIKMISISGVTFSADSFSCISAICSLAVRRKIQCLLFLLRCYFCCAVAHISRLWDLYITQAFDAPSANLELCDFTLRRTVGGHTRSRSCVMLAPIAS